MADGGVIGVNVYWHFYQSQRPLFSLFHRKSRCLSYFSTPSWHTHTRTHVEHVNFKQTMREHLIGRSSFFCASINILAVRFLSRVLCCWFLVRSEDNLTFVSIYTVFALSYAFLGDVFLIFNFPRARVENLGRRRCLLWHESILLDALRVWRAIPTLV